MKLLYCDVCHELIQLRNELRSCYCGSQIGRYLKNNSTVEIASKYLGDAKLVGVSNNFLLDGISNDPVADGGFFAKQKSNITIIPFKKKAKDVKYGDWDTMRAEWLEVTQNWFKIDDNDIRDIQEKIAAEQATNPGRTLGEIADELGYSDSQFVNLLHVLIGGDDMVRYMRMPNKNHNNRFRSQK